MYLLIIFLLIVNNFISSHNLTTKQISDKSDKNNIYINQTSTQNIGVRNIKISTSYTKNRKTESTNKQNNPININAENEIKDRNNRNSFTNNAQKQNIKETINVIVSLNTAPSTTITPAPTKQITTQPTQEIEIKPTKKFTPVIECLDSERNSPCPDRKI